MARKGQIRKITFVYQVSTVNIINQLGVICREPAAERKISCCCQNIAQKIGEKFIM